jgi:hypothetical protein
MNSNEFKQLPSTASNSKKGEESATLNKDLSKISKTESQQSPKNGNSNLFKINENSFQIVKKSTMENLQEIKSQKAFKD